MVVPDSVVVAQEVKADLVVVLAGWGVVADWGVDWVVGLEVVVVV